ncbi:MAG: GlsB/YeaQ/YmgE family stress response membrane protein [Candidatus Kaiserbacteria bacterium]|nr:GlsB/YeaQ/YmgE family stress response membrane protein [Candidatus Kaiserbacteria bacterium]MCB9816017.1 GlsB/YeaQ/YmgE family stress response membrane protein [Candidatus Nomurabacteria bacterium]
MQSKRIISLLTIVGATIGGYVPSLWGDGYFSFASIITSGLGAILGIWIGFKMTRF